MTAPLKLTPGSGLFSYQQIGGLTACGQRPLPDCIVPHWARFVKVKAAAVSPLGDGGFLPSGHIMRPLWTVSRFPLQNLTQSATIYTALFHSGESPPSRTRAETSLVALESLERGDGMVTYSDLFQYTLVLIGLAAVIAAYLNSTKK